MPIRTTVVNRGKRSYPITTRLRYRSGKPHGAYDIAMPIGTPLYAPLDGRVVGHRRGVHNNRRGERIYSGKPSNWVVLEVNLKTNYETYQRATILFQHLSPNVKVRTGQRIKKGSLLGYSGNSGNSTGPHLHVGAQWVPRGQKATIYQRYDHVNRPARRIWPPERFLMEVL